MTIKNLDKQPPSSLGFGVVEIIVTILVVGILSTGFYSITVSNNNIVDQSSDLTYVNALAQNKIEELRSAGFPTLEDGTVDFTDELPNSLGKPNEAEYTITSEDVNLKKVVVTISLDQLGSEQTFEYATFIGELGVGQ